jgi:hypothetical protein
MSWMGWIGLCAMLLACSAAAPEAPATKPALDPITLQLRDAVPSETLRSVLPRIEQELEPYLAGLNPADYERLLQLASQREFARYFSRLSKLRPDQRETLQWLLTRPQLLRTLMMSVSQYDTPDQVLTVLINLRADQKDRLEEFADLAAAACVVWDIRAPETDPEGENLPVEMERPKLLVRYFINARSQLRFDPRTLPWQLSAYVVESQVGPGELIWALNRYARRGSIGGAFFDVPYDYGRYHGLGGNLGDRPYTLPNILLYGGICGDQAHFATEVARAVGVPATVCTGHGATEGTGHAWVGYLDVRGDRAAWNFTEGRYPENQYWRGRVIDPQTREAITDADVSLLAELQYAKPRERLVSDALCKLSDLVDEARRAELYMRAIDLCAGNPRPWHAMARLGAQMKLTGEQTAALRAAVEKFAIKRYPDFAFNILLSSISGRGTDQQLKLLASMRPQFTARPDLLAKIRLAEGDLYRRENRPAQAMAAYGDVLDRHLNIGPIILDAMGRADDLLSEMHEIPRLIALYKLVWQRMPQPEASIAVQGTPFYRIGARYRDLLNEVGQPVLAQTVQSRLDSLTSTVTAGKR